MIRTLYIVHHSHTDVGYTHGQSRIVRWHGQYIRQAMDIAQSRPDFAWTCETFYPVEAFFDSASSSDCERFVALCRAERMGLTAGYLHFTELPDRPLLDAMATRARNFADAHGIPLNAAMLADINGCPLSHARALASRGVKLLLTCVHPHHGYVPLGKRESLFRWDLGDGQHLLVYNSDHYHMGNELGLAPGGGGNYALGFTDTSDPMDDQVLERRLPLYLKRVETTGWTHDFLVVAVSGLITDNAPPSAAIADRIARWNQRHGAEVRMIMTTPTELASVIRAADSAAALPIHGGDWPDWWADGAAGDPEAIALFRHGQRERCWLAGLAQTYPAGSVDLSNLDQSLALYAEHTFGHSNSVSEPWNLLAQQLRLRKLGFAAAASDHAELLTDEATQKLGGGAMAFNRPPRFRVVQPFEGSLRDLVEMEIEGADAVRWGLDAKNLRVVRTDTTQVLPHQVVHSMRGIKVLVDIVLKQGEAIDLALESTPITEAVLPPLTLVVPDVAYDVVGNSGVVPPASLRTDHVEIQWSQTSGITRFRDIRTGRDLLDPSAQAAPFTILASRMPFADGSNPCAKRRNLGRNRNGSDAVWSSSKLGRVVGFERGLHLDHVEFECSLAGCEFLRLKLDAWKNSPRVDAEILMHKTGTWETENLYLALPFSGGPDSQLWIDRGSPVRPWIDQIPGTLVDYAGVQDGLAWCGPDYGVAVAQKDSHLLQMGPLNYGVRQLQGSPGLPAQSQGVYAWLMTNYWETNFSPEVGGFYSFRYSVLWGNDLRGSRTALDACRLANLGVRAIRLAAPRG